MLLASSPQTPFTFRQLSWYCPLQPEDPVQEHELHLVLFFCLYEIRRNSYLYEGVLKGYPSVGSPLNPLHVPLALVGDLDLNTCVLSCFSNVLLCDPMDCTSPPGSPVHGILQARILE